MLLLNGWYLEHKEDSWKFIPGGIRIKDGRISDIGDSILIEKKYSMEERIDCRNQFSLD
jgi:cytosine/adenosine deaminase-related metal-dependent hydrolase